MAEPPKKKNNKPQKAKESWAFEPPKRKRHEPKARKYESNNSLVMWLLIAAAVLFVLGVYFYGPKEGKLVCENSGESSFMKFGNCVDSSK